MASRKSRVVIGIALALGVLAIVRPWTVTPIRTARPQAFDAKTYVSEVWPRVLAEAERTALDIQAARSASQRQHDAGAPPSRRPVFVTVTGLVSEVDRRSRVGIAHMRTGGSSPASVAIQVGPVLRGTAIRDAVSFLTFTEFANQSEFAAVSNALNDRVLRDVLGGLDPESLVGRTVTIVGAATFAGQRNDGPIDLVPLKLRIEEARR